MRTAVALSGFVVLEGVIAEVFDPRNVLNSGMLVDGGLVELVAV